MITRSAGIRDAAIAADPAQHPQPIALVLELPEIC
jgi:hypothetical protein